jgi:ATP-dependent DNA helicase PIF1
VTNTDDYSLEFPSEFLNTINLPGMPSHKLVLKQGMPVMLLRNLDPKNGHCNGVKYVVTFIADHVIEVISISGTNTGKKLFIPRISLISSSATLPFSMRRKQFPIKPAFAMTANKSQGQTLGRVGIYLGTDFFSHGQLYVAMSRCGDPNSIKILKRKEKNSEEKTVRNVVYRAVLN